MTNTRLGHPAFADIFSVSQGGDLVNTLKLRSAKLPAYLQHLLMCQAPDVQLNMVEGSWSVNFLDVSDFIQIQYFS